MPVCVVTRDGETRDNAPANGTPMLLHRLITALVLLPLLLGAIWFAPTAWLYGLFCLVGGLMAWEWAALMGLAARLARGVYVASMLLLLALLWWLPQRAVWLRWLRSGGCTRSGCSVAFRRISSGARSGVRSWRCSAT
jgi:CDP-diglyceride synthetase